MIMSVQIDVNVMTLICGILIGLPVSQCITLPTHKHIHLLHDEVDVRLSHVLHHDVITRQRRSPSYSLPHSLVVEFTTQRAPVQLHLIKSYHITSKVPVHIDNNGIPVQFSDKEFDNLEKPGAYYQDKGTGASFHIQCEKLLNHSCVKYELFGTFPLNGVLHILESAPSSALNEQNSYRILKVYLQTGLWGDTEQPDDSLQKRSFQKERRSRVKRATGTYTVELYAVIDYSLYEYWYNDNNGSTSSSHNRQYAISRIRTFAGFHINGIDFRFKDLSTTGFQISVNYAGIYIAEKRSVSSWTEEVVTQAGTADAVTVLTKFGDWISSNAKSLPKHDHAMLFTGYDLTKSGSKSIKGYASVGAICTNRSQSIVEETFNFIVETAAAHELGHSLGAIHDGEGSNTCRANEYFIMTPSLSARTGAFAHHPWKFSKCSADEIRTVLDRLDADSSNCLKSIDSSVNPNYLQSYMKTQIGQLYDVNEQCERNYGDRSYACLTMYTNGYADICTGLWCSSYNDQCVLMIPADGTTCGNKKWCQQGECVKSQNAPEEDENCLYGDSEGEKINGMLCPQMLSEFPWYCYNKNVRKICCSSCDTLLTGRQECLYGDRINCSALSSGVSCYAGNNSNLCCSSCQKYRTGRQDCPYGDKRYGCLSSLCYLYIQSALDECCETCSTGHTSTTDDGHYGTTTRSSETTTRDSGSSSLVIPIAAGVGGVVLILIIVGVVCYCVRKSPSGADKDISNNLGMVNKAYNLSEGSAYPYNYISTKHVQGPRVTSHINSRRQEQQPNLPPRPSHPPPRTNNPPSRSDSIQDSHIYAEISDVEHYTSLQNTPNGQSTEYTKLSSSELSPVYKS